MILNAVNQYMADNNSAIPSVITTYEQEISKSQVDLCSFIVPEYVAAFLTDPKVNKREAVKDCGVSYSTGYTIYKNPSRKKITVRAPSAELGERIEIAR